MLLMKLFGQDNPLNSINFARNLMKEPPVLHAGGSMLVASSTLYDANIMKGR
jgi:hypothetical protein